MNLSKRITILLPLAATVLGTACAAPTETPVGSDDALTLSKAQSACGSSYATARAAYGKAKDTVVSKDPELCEADRIAGVAIEAAAAQKACAAFSEVFASSNDAKPIREILANTLTLKFLTGNLSAKDAATVSGIQNALPGTIMKTTSAGVYGEFEELAFAPNGAVTYRTYALNRDTGKTMKSNYQATYAVEDKGILVSWTTSDKAGHELRLTLESASLPNFVFSNKEKSFSSYSVDGCGD